MYQQQIEFFWPLTEQIPLDLNYTECYDARIDRTLATCDTVISMNSTFPSAGAWTTSSFKMQENQTTMVVVKEPNFIRKLIYKLIGFKWEVN